MWLRPDARLLVALRRSRRGATSVRLIARSASLNRRRCRQRGNCWPYFAVVGLPIIIRCCAGDAGDPVIFRSQRTSCLVSRSTAAAVPGRSRSAQNRLSNLRAGAAVPANLQHPEVALLYGKALLRRRVPDVHLGQDRLQLGGDFVLTERDSSRSLILSGAWKTELPSARSCEPSRTRAR